MASPFQAINAALAGNKTSDGGTLNKKGIDTRSFGANPNLSKLKELGMSEMPEGGQEELDQKYAEFQKSKPKDNKPKSRLQKMYKDSN